MLPRPHEQRIANHSRFPRHEGPHAIGNESVRCPVTTADDIAAANRGDGVTMLIARRVGERGPISVGDQFRAGFAVAVGVLSPQAVVFFETTDRVVIFITLVAGHDERHPHAGGLSYRLQEMYGPITLVA